MIIQPTRVQVTRLTVLADYCDKQVERKSFSMRRWGCSAIRKVTRGEKFDCGMTACAGGYACLIPSFQKEGLFMDFTGPIYNDQYGHAALREFFGLDSLQETFLFDAFQDDGFTHLRLTPKQWAKRCRNFIADLPLPI